MSSVTEAGSQLRWVRYDGIYYAALLVPTAEAPVGASGIPEGHHFVFFLPDSGAVVPDSDIEPYDPANLERSTNPAAMEGVAMANAMFYGPSGTSVAPAPMDGAAGELEMLDEDNNVDLLNLLGRLDEDEEERHHRAKKEKRRVAKEAKRAEKEARREAKKEAGKRSRKDAETASAEDDDIGETLGITSTRKDQKRVSKQDANDLESDEEDESSVKDNHWNAMVEDFDLGDSPARVQPVSARRGRGAAAGVPSTRLGLDSALRTLVSQGSPVSVYLPQIKHSYMQLWNEAMSKQMLLSAYEVDVVHTVENMLLAREAKAAVLENALADQIVTKAEKEAISRSLAQLEDVNIDAIVRDVVNLRPARTVTDTTRVGRASNANFTRFQDPLINAMVRNAVSAAEPRELTQDMANKYREQLIHRERVLAASRSSGLGKIGLHGVTPSYMENWNRARELMVLAPVHENQPVKPNGYVSRHHAEAFSKVESHALKRLSTGLALQHPQTSMQAPATGGSSFMTHSHFKSAESLADLFQNYSARRTQQTLPAYYAFHDLSSRGALGVTPGGGVGSTAGLMSSFLNSYSEEPHRHAMDPHQPIVSPMHLDFDHRVAFAMDGSDPAGLTSKTPMASASVHLQSEESQWYSEAYSVGSGVDGSLLPSRKGGTSSRASSVASSNMRGSMRRSTGEEAVSRKPADWRSCAKRAILEQLTLYFRGLKGRPAVITEEELQSTARKLLERAMRCESSRQGVSMVLQVNNDASHFTKTVEARLKKSVDSYVQKHFIDSHPVYSNAAHKQTSTRMPMAAVDRLVRSGFNAPTRGAEDSPVYQ